MLRTGGGSGAGGTDVARLRHIGAMGTDVKQRFIHSIVVGR